MKLTKSFCYCEKHDRWDDVITLKKCNKCSFLPNEDGLTQKEKNKLYKGLEIDD